MQRFLGFISALVPVVVIGSLFAFVFYAIYIYQPSDRLACSPNFAVRQADIAVHVLRQWAGKEGQDYAGCTVEN
jgi:hypothetical protein